MRRIALGLLRARRERPRGRRAAEQRDELAAHGSSLRLPDRSKQHYRRRRQMAERYFTTEPADVRFGSKADMLHCNMSCPLYPRKRTCAVQH